MELALYYCYFAALIVALGHTTFRLVAINKKYQALTVVAISCVILCHFIETWYKMIYRPDFEFEGGMLRLTNFITSIIIPLLYTYTSRQFHIRLLSATTYCLYGITLVCVFESMYLTLDNVFPAEPIDRPHIHIYLKGQEILYWNIYEVSLFFQALMVSLKIYKLRRKMKRERWSLTPHGMKYLTVVVIAMVLALLIALLPDNAWNSVTTATYMGTYTVLGLILLWMIANRYDKYAIVNEKNEPEYLEVRPSANTMMAQFERLVNDEKIYLNPHLSLVDAAQMLGTNRTYVSKMVNENYGDSFSNYINSKRLEYAKAYMKEHPRDKIEVIANECGFGSTSSFNKYFKSALGITPSAWMKGGPAEEQLETPATEDNEEE